MCILIRDDLKMSKGKVLAQVSHAMVDASVKAYTQSQLFFKWKADGEKIVILKEEVIGLQTHTILVGHTISMTIKNLKF